MNKTVPEILQAFDALSACGLRVSKNTAGRKAANWQEEKASIAFCRLVLNCLSILRLCPGNSWHTSAKGLVIWDLGSIVSLSRNLIECYFTLHYLSQRNLSADEIILREKIWKYHEIFERLEMLESGVPKSKGIETLKRVVSKWKRQLEGDARFQNLDADKKKGIIEGKIAKLSPRKNLCISAGVGQKFFETVFKYGSSHSHASPFSLEEMDRFGAHNENPAHAMRLALEVSIGFLALGIRDYINLHPDQASAMSAHETKLLKVWAGVLKWNQQPARLDSVPTFSP